MGADLANGIISHMLYKEDIKNVGFFFNFQSMLTFSSVQ